MRSGEFFKGIYSRPVKASVAVLAASLALSGCAGCETGPASSSDAEAALKGLIAAGFTSPKFTIDNPRKELLHTNLHVDITINIPGCNKTVDTPVDALTTEHGIEFEPIAETSPFEDTQYLNTQQFIDANC